jgi:hypothetical protein
MFLGVVFWLMAIIRHVSIPEVIVGAQAILTLSLGGSVEKRTMKVFAYCLFATVEWHIV